MSARRSTARQGVERRDHGGQRLDMFRRFAVEPGLIGLDWSGYHYETMCTLMRKELS